MTMEPTATRARSSLSEYVASDWPLLIYGDTSEIALSQCQDMATPLALYWLLETGM